MQAVLVMFRSDGEKRSFSLSREMTVIGRRQDCDLMIPLGEISRKHCRIIREGDTLRLEDLGSSNGTFHNGRRIQEIILSPGDTIQVGPVTFVIQIDGVPSDDEVQPFAHGAAAGAAATAGEDELEELPNEPPAIQTRSRSTPADDELEVLDEEGGPPVPGADDELEVLNDDEAPPAEEEPLEILDDEAPTMDLDDTPHPKKH